MRDFWISSRYVVIGALCPIVLINLKEDNGFGARTTRDVDVLVEVKDWDQYHRLLDSLEENGFKRMGGSVEHRLVYKKQEVDILPYSRNLSPDDRMTWPESGNVIDVSGFEDSFIHARSVDIHENGTLKINLLPLPLSVFTKAIAFTGRQYPRDLIDITYILLHYEEIQVSERRYDEMIPPDLLYELRGAYLLGHDLKTMMPQEKILKLDMFFEMIQNEELPALREVLEFHRLEYIDWRSLINTLRSVLF